MKAYRLFEWTITTNKCVFKLKASSESRARELARDLLDDDEHIISIK